MTKKDKSITNSRTLIPDHPRTFLRRQRIHHDIDPEPCVINCQESFVAEVVIPFAAVIFVAVQYPDPAVDDNCFQIIVHKVVAPAV